MQIDKLQKINLKELGREELTELVTEKLGQPKFRAKQLEEWLWTKNVNSFDEMTNIPKTLREQLEEISTVSILKELTKQESSDGTRKYLVEFNDGVSVECVGMPSGNKLSVCVSSQAGCGMGCAFCATGKSGLTRSLTDAEIYDQVMHISKDFNKRVSSVVLMGQGEPMMNYNNALAAMRKLNSPDGAGIGARHITISTCGVLPMIKKFMNEPEQFTLAVSLHSAVQKTRDMLMPGVKKYSLVHLYSMMGEYTDKTGRRPSYEYAMIDGINDTDNELDYLIEFCRGTLCHVNLIKLNEIPGSKFHPSKEIRVKEFVNQLSRVGVEVTVRNSRGNDIDAACGQLKQYFTSK